MAGDELSVDFDGEVADPKKQHVLKPGGRVLLRTPGGGGYGDPAQRTDAARALDRKLGYLE